MRHFPLRFGGRKQFCTTAKSKLPSRQHNHKDVFRQQILEIIKQIIPRSFLFALKSATLLADGHLV
jgi:hypothetical protein